MKHFGLRDGQLIGHRYEVVAQLLGKAQAAIRKAGPQPVVALHVALDHVQPGQF